MQAVRLVSWQSEPELCEIEVPDPGPGAVLVEVEATGLCHSDLHVMDWPAGTLAWDLPVTLGHEVAGRVAALGAGASGVEVGDAVLVYGPWGCGVCRQCASGAENLCERAGVLPRAGCGLGFDGGLAEYVLVPRARLWACGVLLAIMAGAAATHLLHGEPRRVILNVALSALLGVLIRVGR